jgi:predicted dehydrogenase
MSENGNDPFGYNRRDFLKSGSFATLMTMMGGVELLAQSSPAPAEGKTAGAKFKVAVIGLGDWGRRILTELMRSESADVAAICDTYGAFLRRSSKMAPGAKPFEDYKVILEDKDIKAVIVATPTHKHKDIVLAALKANKHVYCVAPLANTIEDAREIALAAKKAKKQIFQAGLQMRADPQRQFLLPFIRTGALGKTVMARAQWHKKQSWRTASSDPEQEKALNWRLSKATSTGLIGEIGIHQIDQAGWFLNAHPVSVTGFGSLRNWTDGRDVADTVQAIFEFPRGVRFFFDCTLATSFDADYEMYYGSDAAVILRENKAWMFKEVDSPLLGWEVYARKDIFSRYHSDGKIPTEAENVHKETGIALILGGSKQTAMDAKADAEAAAKETPLFKALDAFVRNSGELNATEEHYIASYGASDPDGLLAELATVRATQASHRPGAGYLDGFHAVVTAIKANEAVLGGERLTFKPEWYELG